MNSYNQKCILLAVLQHQIILFPHEGLQLYITYARSAGDLYASFQMCFNIHAVSLLWEEIGKRAFGLSS